MSGFRTIWSDNPKDRSPRWIKNGDNVAIRKFVDRMGRIDCYTTLNVYPDYDAEPSHYDHGFDFDNGADLRVSAAAALKLIAYLDDHEIPNSVFFSGRKGFHVVVRQEHSGLAARKDGGHIHKLWCQSLTDKLELTSMDNSIHGKSRLWRLPNTINSKSGLYKVQITWQELYDFVIGELDSFSDLAKAPRPVTWAEPILVPALVTMLEPFVKEANRANAQRLEQLNENRNVAFTSLPVCINDILNDPLKVIRQAETWGKRIPSRNNLTFIATTFFKTHRGYNEEQALHILGDAWQSKIAPMSASTPKIIARSTATAVHAVYNSSAEFSCGNAISRGCSCWAGCPLFRKFEDARRSNDTTGPRPGSDESARGVDSPGRELDPVREASQD